jgi:hypothetical protein
MKFMSCRMKSTGVLLRDSDFEIFELESSYELADQDSAMQAVYASDDEGAAQDAWMTMARIVCSLLTGTSVIGR